MTRYRTNAAWPLAAALAILLLGSSVALGQSRHPNAWQTGVDIAGFEGDVYSALNLSGQEAAQFGTFFSSALYGISLGDAYSKMSDGDVGGALDILGKATSEFAIGLSPWGAAYAALKLITWAPPAFVRSLTEFNVSTGFAAYSKMRTEPGGQYGLPEDPIDFTSDAYKAWRAQARGAFEYLWPMIEHKPGYGAYCDSAREAIRKQRLSKWGWWESWFSSDYKKTKRQVITLGEIKTWTFANWEGRVVVDVLSNYVPKRIEATRRDMMATPVDITFRLVDQDGGPVEVVAISMIAGGSATPQMKKGQVWIETWLGDLPELTKRRQLLLSVQLKGQEKEARAGIPAQKVLDKSGWTRTVEFKVSRIKIDLGTVRLGQAERDASLDVRTQEVKDVIINLGYGATRSLLEAVGAEQGTLPLQLRPGSYAGWVTGTGLEGRPVRRMAFMQIPLPEQGDPKAASVTLDNTSVISDAGTLGAITSAINANANHLRSSKISPEEFRHATRASLGKAEGTAKQADGTERSVRELAAKALAKVDEQLQQDAKSDLAQRARDLKTEIDGLVQTVPEEYRGAFYSPEALQGFVDRLMQEAAPTGQQFPYGPTRAIELTINYVEGRKAKLEELLGPVAGGFRARVQGARSRSDGIFREYQRDWALLTFGDTSVDSAVRALAAGKLATFESVSLRAEHILAEDPAGKVTSTITSLKEALVARKDAVGRAQQQHTALINQLESYRTVTLTDAAKVASALAQIETMQTAVRYLQYADGVRDRIQKADDPSRPGGVGSGLPGHIRSLEQALADEALTAALAQLGVPAMPDEPGVPVVARVARQAYRLAALQQRVTKALALGSDVRQRYRQFRPAHQVLLEDPEVTDEVLRVPAGVSDPRPSGGWFSGRNWLSPATLKEHAAYDFSALDTLERSVTSDATKAFLMGPSIMAPATGLLGAVQEDEAAYDRLNKELREALGPYEKAAAARQGTSAELSKALNDGLDLRSRQRARLGQATTQCEAPFHLEKVADETTEALKRADAGYAALVAEYYERVVAAVAACGKRVRDLEAEVKQGWQSPETIERFLWTEPFEQALMKAADMGPHGTGDRDLNWKHSFGTRAWVVEGVREQMPKGDAAVGQAWNRHEAVQEEVRATYRSVFSNKARLSHPLPGSRPVVGQAPSRPRAAGKLKLTDRNPAIGKIAWAHDGRVIAWHMMIASISLIPSTGGEMTALENVRGWFGGSGTSPAFSPNGLLLVHEGPWSGGRIVKSTDLNGVTRTITTDRKAELVFRRADGAGLQTLLELNATKAGIDDITRLQVAPDGRLFLGWIAADQSGYGWLDPDTAEMHRVVVDGGTLDPDLSADGKWVTYTQKATKKLFVAAAVGGARDMGAIARDPAVSPRGKWIVYCYGDKVMIAPTSGGKPTELFKRSGVSLLSWSPMGDAIAYRRFGEGEVGLWVTRLK